jgi:glycosyltransferase involved in cell wall biosynthesis
MNSKPLREQQWADGTLPAVSVFSWTYNHCRYIRQSIESILDQETDFPVEIIIHDDASTDGTTEIVMEYTEKFPHLFRNIIQKENQFSQGKCLLKPLLHAPRSELIALTHGDDYWCDPSKLRNQHELLRSYPLASGCFHAADDVNEITSQTTPGFWRPKYHRDYYQLEDIFSLGNFTCTCAVMYRKSVLPDTTLDLSHILHGDYLLLMSALKWGPIYFLDKTMSAYRRHMGGVHTSSYGVASSLHAAQAIVESVYLLGLSSHPGFLESFRWRLKECLTSHERSMNELETLRVENNKLSRDFARFRSSKIVKSSIYANQLLKKLLKKQQ